jgi:hypothetical protein
MALYPEYQNVNKIVFSPQKKRDGRFIIYLLFVI